MFKERKDAIPVITGLTSEPKIFIEPIAIEKMSYYVSNCAKEIGWLGTVRRINDFFLIDDVFLFKQQVHATTCEISPEGIADFVTECITTFPETGMEIINSLKMWGHSHVNMGVSPSGQDDTQMINFQDQNEWFLRVIANKLGEMEFTLFDFKSGLKFKNVKWAINTPSTNGLEEAIKLEITEKVKDIVSTPIRATGSYWQGYGYDDFAEYERYEYANGSYVKKKEVEPGKSKIITFVDGKVQKPGDASIDDCITMKNADGKWVTIDRRDDMFSLKTEVIEYEFTSRQLETIGKCDDLQGVMDLLDTYRPLGEYSFEDGIDILSYASNKYPA